MSPAKPIYTGCGSVRDWAERRMEAEDWLRYAERDLLVARHALEPLRVFEAAFFHAQQAGEKALKALIAGATESEIPRTHRLRLLAVILHDHGVATPPPETLGSLDAYGVGVRYPDTPPPSSDEAAKAVGYATDIVNHVQTQLQYLDQLHEQRADDNQDAGTEDPGH